MTILSTSLRSLIHKGRHPREDDSWLTPFITNVRVQRWVIHFATQRSSRIVLTNSLLPNEILILGVAFSKDEPLTLFFNNNINIQERLRGCGLITSFTNQLFNSGSSSVTVRQARTTNELKIATQGSASVRDGRRGWWWLWRSGKEPWMLLIRTKRGVSPDGCQTMAESISYRSSSCW